MRRNDESRLLGCFDEIDPVLSSVTSVSRGQFHQVAYADWGQAGADVVLCLHGLTRQGRDFDFLARALVACDRRVICPDLVGRGLSPDSPDRQPIRVRSWTE